MLLSDVGGLGGSEDDRCLPAVSMIHTSQHNTVGVVHEVVRFVMWLRGIDFYHQHKYNREREPSQQTLTSDGISWGQRWHRSRWWQV